MHGGEVIVVEIVYVAHTEDILGEVPRWHPTEQVLYWIDAFKPAIHRLDPVSAALESWTPPEKLGSFAPRVGRGLLIAGGAVNILNDGRCDRRGRFWVGSMSKTMERASGLLYRLERGHLDAVDHNIWVANGVCWSPDDTQMYFADSHVRTIFVYDFDLASGGIGPRRVLATMDDRPGVPDGSSVDAEGFVWNAVFDGGCLLRYSPDGRLDRTVQLPDTGTT